MVLPMLAERMALEENSGNHLVEPAPWIAFHGIDVSAQAGPDPERPGVFYWDGTAHRITTRNWKLLRIIYGRSAVEIPSVGKYVWGDDLTLESTLRGQIHRLNKTMAKLNIPLAWRTEMGQVIPEAKQP